MAPNTDFRLKTGYVKALVVFRTNLAFISTTNGAQLQHRPRSAKSSPRMFWQQRARKISVKSESFS